MKKLLLLAILCATVPFAFAQNAPILTDENITEELNAIFARARNASATSLITQQFQTNFSPAQTNSNFHDTFTNISPFIATQGHAQNQPFEAASSLTPFAADNTSPAAQRAWQVGLVMSSETRPINETVNELKGQVSSGHIALAALLDVTMLPNQPAGKTKKPGTKGSGKLTDKDKSSTGRTTADVYIIFPEGGKVSAVKRTIQVTPDSDKLVATVLDNLKAQQNK